jgi:hypothetical protein
MTTTETPITRRASKKAGTKKKKASSKKKKADPNDQAELLRRMQNRLLLDNRIHFGRTAGRTVGQFGGNIIAGIFDPLTGLSELFGFIEGTGAGLRDGVQTSRLIFVQARASASNNGVKTLEARLKKLKAKRKKANSEILSDEELEALTPDLMAALS